MAGRWPYAVQRTTFKPAKTLPVHLRLRKWRITRGDLVYIRDGKDAGMTGRVREVLRKRNAVIVSGRNLAYKHVQKSDSAPTGRIQKEMPIHYSNVAIAHPETKRPVKIEVRAVVDAKTGKSENKRFVRGTSLEVPRNTYLEYQTERAVASEWDTAPEAVTMVTYTPSLAVPPLPEGVVDELRNKYGVQRIEKERRRAALEV